MIFYYRRRKKVLGAILILSFFSFYSNAQSSVDQSILLQKCKQGGSVQVRTENFKTLKFAPVRILFGFYRNVISEQISADCAFNLSCSRFSVASIKRFGFLKGGLLTADRLTRCHRLVGNETDAINFDTFTGKVIDVPESY